MFEFVPGPGKHLVPYDGRLFFVDRAREQQSVCAPTPPLGGASLAYLHQWDHGPSVRDPGAEEEGLCRWP